MDTTRLELLLHPVRLRIVQVMQAQGGMTTQEIGARLPEIAQSSIYRHMKLLLEGGLIAVTETRLVNGIEEKRYTVAPANIELSPEDLDGMTAAEHLQFFTIFAHSLIENFGQYLGSADLARLAEDGAGYRTMTFYATPEERQAFIEAFSSLIAGALAREPGSGRSLHQLSFVLHPVQEPGADEDPAA